MLAEAVVTIVEKYLGVAARRFVNRQIRSHLDKSPEALSAEDIPRLAEWVKISMAFLTEDKEIIDEVATKINNLAK